MKKILCTICARAGSKGLKNKNIINFFNKPLIYYTISQAKMSKQFTNIVVSTNSKKIFKLANKYGADCWYLRSKKLSDDYASKVDVIIDTLINSEKKFKIKYDLIMDLDVTSPLRNVQDIKKSIKLLKDKKKDFLLSANDSKKNPYFNMVELKKNNTVQFIKKGIRKVRYNRRQDTPKTYDINASMYLWKRKTLLNSFKFFPKKTILYKMPIERSWDIDTKIDLKLVKFFKKIK